MAHLATREMVQWSFAAKGVARMVVGAGSSETLPSRHGDGWSSRVGTKVLKSN